MNARPISHFANQVTIRRVNVEEILDLRHRILHSGQPQDYARFETDTVDNTWHLGLFYLPKSQTQEHVVTCASFMFEMYKGEKAWRLRGLCTEKEFEKKGYASLLLWTAESEIKADTRRATLLWCDARMSAVSFYEKEGWTIDPKEEPVEIKFVGPGRKMYKRIA